MNAENADTVEALLLQDEQGHYQACVSGEH
jgi:hypothetical protein